jgi:hypothetical protein
MARSYPAPDAFPGMRPEGWTYGGTNPDTPRWALDREPDDRDYDVAPDPALKPTITPGRNMVSDAGVKSSPNPFPGYPGTQPGGGSGAGGAYGHDAGPVMESTRPSTSGSVAGNRGPDVLNAPNAFPGGNQIPAGASDTTGTTGPRRLRRDTSAGTLP